MIQLLQQRERGVDGAGTRGVGAAEFLLDLLDQLVPVAGLFGDQREQHQAQVAGAENPAAAAATEAAATASAGPFVGSVPMAVATSVAVMGAATAAAAAHSEFTGLEGMSEVPVGGVTAAAAPVVKHSSVKHGFSHCSS